MRNTRVLAESERRVAVNYTIKKRVKDGLRQHCDESGKSASFIVNLLIQEYLDASTNQ